MSKEDIQYLITLIQMRLRGWVEVPPDNVIRQIIDDMWEEFGVIQHRRDKEAQLKKLIDRLE